MRKEAAVMLSKLNSCEVREAEMIVLKTIKKTRLQLIEKGFSNGESYEEAIKAVFDKINLLYSSPERNNNDTVNSSFSDTIPENCVNALVMMLTPQRQMIENIHRKLPDKASDNYSLGYIMGVCSAISNELHMDQTHMMDLIATALYLAYGNDGGRIGKKEVELLEILRELAFSLPEGYIQGQGSGASDYDKTIRSEMPIWGWYLHLESGTI